MSNFGFNFYGKNILFYFWRIDFSLELLYSKSKRPIINKAVAAAQPNLPLPSSLIARTYQFSLIAVVSIAYPFVQSQLSVGRRKKKIVLINAFGWNSMRKSAVCQCFMWVKKEKNSPKSIAKLPKLPKFTKNPTDEQ